MCPLSLSPITSSYVINIYVNVMDTLARPGDDGKKGGLRVPVTRTEELTRGDNR